MTEKALFNETLNLALRLSPKDRIRLIEQVASSVEHELDQDVAAATHWGTGVAALIESLDMSDWQAQSPDDPVEWVEQLRHADFSRLRADWDASE